MDKKDTTQDELKKSSSDETIKEDVAEIEDDITEKEENAVELETQETEVFVMGSEKESETQETKTEVLVAQFPSQNLVEVEKTNKHTEAQAEKNENTQSENEQNVSEIIIEQEEPELEEIQDYVEEVEENTEEVQKQKSTIRIFFENLHYKLSYIPALAFVGVMAVISFFGLLFFLSTGKIHLGNKDVENACLIMVLFFALMFVLFSLLFITSIVLNIIRKCKGKK